ncbi:MAG TPA: ATP-binding protein [Candidatus Acidoferrales bacterium]|nr:ATP-binding protein [Candidatus Acidoferrales bacterium]
MSAEGIAVAVLVAVVAVVAAFAIGRELALRRIREMAGGRPDEPPASAVRSLLERTEQAARRARQEAEDLVYLTGLVGAGIVRLDDELVVTSANRAADLYLEVAQGSLVGTRLPHRPAGRPAGDADHAAVGLGDVRLDAIVRTAWRNGSAADEVALGGPDGRALSVRARRSPGGGVWVVIDDLSELRRLQRIRTEFVDNLSHELRTPLTTVRLLTETLARDLEEIEVPPRVVDIVQKIDVETGHLVQMATELLDLAKIEQGQGQPLYIDDVDLGPIVTSTLDRLRLFAQRQGVRLRSEIDPDVPPVLGDAERLGQLLINLVHNAIKFSPSGGAVVVRARGEPAADTPGLVTLEVEDRGVGIPAEDLPRVFERFYKVDKARVRGAGGTGLGLSIVRHIAEDHGGRVSVDSTEGAGSTFRVVLPAAPPVPSSTHP